MGNLCFCNNSPFIQDVNLDNFPHLPIVNTKTDQMPNKDSYEIDKSEPKLYNLIKYFNEGEKEIFNIKKKEKSRKNSKVKKISQKNFDFLKDNKQYEHMLKRILEQKTIKRFGPKRRDTIRNEEIKNMIDEVLQENKDIIESSKIKKSENSDVQSSIIIKNISNKNNRFSIIFDRNGIYRHNKKNLDIMSQYYKIYYFQKLCKIEIPSKKFMLEEHLKIVKIKY